MLKIIPPGSQDFGEEAVRPVKLSARGLRGHDRRDLEKRAGAGIVDAFRDLELHPGEVPIHLIALGATHKYSCNRNADGFPEETCRRDHPTFVKHAMFYRAHLNTDPARSYGRVAHSYYNEPMARIELIAALNGTKGAADRNGGLLADREMEKLARGDAIAVSMATAIPYDVCSACENKARVKAEYCDERRCTKYGGLRNHVGQTFADGHTLHMSNVINKWKDISHVTRPADRTAYVLGRLEKAASAAVDGSPFAPDDDLEDAIIPELFRSPLLAAQAKAAAALERACRQVTPPGRLLAFSAPCRFGPALMEKAASVLAASAALAATLPLEAFLALAAGDVALAKAAAARVAPYVPGAYAELLAEGEDAFRANPFAATPAHGMVSAAIREALEPCRLDKRAVARRAAMAALSDPNLPKLRGFPDPGRGPSPALAAASRRYALYKVAALSPHVDSPDFGHLIAAAAAQDLAASLAG